MKLAVLGEIARENKVITQMGNQSSAGSGLRESATLIRAGLLGKVSKITVWSHRLHGEANGTSARVP